MHSQHDAGCRLCLTLCKTIIMQVHVVIFTIMRYYVSRDRCCICVASGAAMSAIWNRDIAI